MRWLGKSLRPPGRGRRSRCSRSGEDAAAAPTVAASKGPRTTATVARAATPLHNSKFAEGMSSCGITSPTRWRRNPSAAASGRERTVAPPTAPVATCRVVITVGVWQDPGMELIHTCYRITDVDRSVAFYEVLGFEERGRLPIRDEAINVFMGLPGDADRLELTFNFGVDSYELGTGYGHIAVTVDDLDATLERLAAQRIEPERPPYTVREGGSRLCFVRDPDGYRIELIERRG